MLRRKLTTVIGSTDTAVAPHQSLAAGSASATGISPRRAAAMAGSSGASALSGAGGGGSRGDLYSPQSLRSPPPPLPAATAAAARKPVQSAFSVDPYSREARSNGSAGAGAAAAAATSTADTQDDDAHDMIAELVDTAAELQRELQALRLENNKLRAGRGGDE